MLKKIIAVAFIILTTNPFIQAQQFTADIKDLSFIAGKWVTPHQWGDMEENWGEPIGNTMICSFRCVKDGKVVFYEFIVIEQSDSVPVMKLRHFGPGSIAWEEKDKPNEYPLAKLEKNTAVFQAADKKLRMTFTRKDKQHLSVSLEREVKTGKWEKDVFDYTLKN